MVKGMSGEVIRHLDVSPAQTLYSVLLPRGLVCHAEMRIVDHHLTLRDLGMELGGELTCVAMGLVDAYLAHFSSKQAQDLDAVDHIRSQKPFDQGLVSRACAALMGDRSIKYRRLTLKCCEGTIHFSYDIGWTLSKELVRIPKIDDGMPMEELFRLDTVEGVVLRIDGKLTDIWTTAEDFTQFWKAMNDHRTSAYFLSALTKQKGLPAHSSCSVDGALTRKDLLSIVPSV
jgi:hypothetical protein